MRGLIGSLGDVAEFINGAAFKPEDWGDQGARIIRIQNLTDPTKPYNRTTRAVSERIHIQPGDLLVSWSATLGVFEWEGPDVAYLNQHIFRVVPDERKVDKRYLRHALELALLDMRKHLHGATMLHVNRGEFLATELFLPALSEQRRIAAILDKADALRNRRRETLAQLDRLAQSIFVDVMHRAERERCVRVSKLEKVFWFQEGPGVRKWQFTDAGVKLLNVGNIEKSGVLDLTKTERHVSDEEANGKYKHFLCDAGDLVIASSGISIQEDGLLATRGAFVESRHLPLCMNTSTVRFKPLGDASLDFLRAWLASIEFRSQITRLVTGSAQLNFGPSHLRELHISLPTKSQQDFITTYLRTLQDRRLIFEESCQTAEDLFLSLQSRAFNGQL